MGGKAQSYHGGSSDSFENERPHESTGPHGGGLLRASHEPGLLRISETYRALDDLTDRPHPHDRRLLRRHDLLPCLSSGTHVAIESIEHDALKVWEVV